MRALHVVVVLLVVTEALLVWKVLSLREEVNYWKHNKESICVPGVVRYFDDGHVEACAEANWK